MSHYIIGNWKMNLGISGSRELASAIIPSCKDLKKTKVGIAPSFTALATVSDLVKGSGLSVGAQNSHWELEGAFTGEISPKMLIEIGCSFAIVGHSERRHGFGESSDLVAKRSAGVVKSGLSAIICIGETLPERESGRTEERLKEQMNPLLTLPIDKIQLAYEPVWAIGTGRVATVEQIEAAHQFIATYWRDKAKTEAPPILYGGSVTPANFTDIAKIRYVSGALVGGASLKADSFCKLIEILE